MADRSEADGPTPAGGDGHVHQFDRLMGPRRGLTDARTLSAQLVGAERELEAAVAEIGGLSDENGTLANAVQTLEARVAQLEDELDGERRALRSSERDRDRARYAVLRAGGRDPMAARHYAHHGLWTPGRPYLVGQHADDASTGCCYEARVSVRPGDRPSKSRRWRCCLGDDCPTPAPIDTSPHRAFSGYALRQARSWWDSSNTEWELRELSDEHLLAVVGYLRDMRLQLWLDELDDRSTLRVPCPAHAYASPASWLADSPLMRALLAERRRRRLRTRPPARRWRWGHEHPF